jgi:hypothetical protein
MAQNVDENCCCTEFSAHDNPSWACNILFVHLPKMAFVNSSSVFNLSLYDCMSHTL